MYLIRDAGTYRAPQDGAANDYAENFRRPDLSVGTYSIPAGGVDDQSPHTEDEIYVVTAGRARIVTEDGEAPLGPGDVVYVPAHEGHRFTEVSEDLSLLVFFAPAYGSRG